VMHISMPRPTLHYSTRCSAGGFDFVEKLTL
jgi:hypothetical protein